MQVTPKQQSRHGKSQIEKDIAKVSTPNLNLIDIHNIKMCPVHSLQLSLYCANDGRVLCTDCLYNSQEHAQHQVVPITQKLMKQVNEKTMMNIPFKLQSIEHTIEINAQSKLILENCFQEAQLRLKKEFEYLAMVLSQRQAALAEQVNRYFNSKIQIFSSHIAELNQIKQLYTQQLQKFIQQNNRLNCSGSSSDPRSEHNSEYLQFMSTYDVEASLSKILTLTKKIKEDQ